MLLRTSGGPLFGVVSHFGAQIHKNRTTSTAMRMARFRRLRNMIAPLRHWGGDSGVGDAWDGLRVVCEAPVLQWSGNHTYLNVEMGYGFKFCQILLPGRQVPTLLCATAARGQLNCQLFPRWVNAGKPGGMPITYSSFLAREARIT